MLPITIDPENPSSIQTAVGSLLCEGFRFGDRRLPKGHQIQLSDLELLGAMAQPVNAVQLEPGDIPENDAALRIGAAVMGQGLEQRGPLLSRVNLVATRKGLLRVNAEAVRAIDEIPDIALFTMTDRLPVLPGKVVAGAKITPLATPESNLRQVEKIAGQASVLEVKPFLPLAVAVVSTESMADKARVRFQETLTRKIAWFGGSVISFNDLSEREDEMGAVILQLIDSGAQLILSGGGNTVDPQDPTLAALTEIGADIVRLGAPIHPGSMFWLAYRNELPIFNVASCSMYSKATVVDLVLPWVMAGEGVTPGDMAQIGYGGLLDRGMQFRFPAYDNETDAAIDEL